MRIAITTSGKDLDAPVDPRFGRAKSFVIYDTDTGQSSVLDNAQNLNAAQGAGIQAATAVANAGAQALLTGNCGPKAFRALSAGKVTVYTGVSGTVREAVEKFRSGTLQPAAGASVDAHAGMGL
ncbi:MAG TPA: NifB/NifX family molybdenum-iron cluster-binding protein [Planctomycetota bacterium]|nr:NifB/NifX family molybdenum-iron cluster-binding protein [Planctomycetota bacterium]